MKWQIQAVEWWSSNHVTREYAETKETVVCFVTDLPINDALAKLKYYEARFKDLFGRNFKTGTGSIIEWRILSIESLPEDIDLDILASLGARKITLDLEPTGRNLR